MNTGAAQRQVIGTHPRPLHAAYIYRHSLDCVAPLVFFAQDGLARGEAVSVGVLAPLGRLLGRALGEPGPRAAFFDMAELGRNPGRIIPALLDFAAAHADPPLRHVSQPFRAGPLAAQPAD